jgi:glycosyltransferase involved in cell wall biosynthesis
MMPLKVAVVADYLEEGWPSMDLVADMLVERLSREHANRVQPTLIRPPMPRRFVRIVPRFARRGAFGVDRVLARQWDYPRMLERTPDCHDVYHVVDHSYAHLVHVLPAGRTLVTCHDVDAFRSIARPAQERRSLPFRWMSRRILSGLRTAARVACDSEATRDALVTLADVDDSRLSVIPNGTDTDGSAEADAPADLEVARLLGPPSGPELLHVGSTIPRKRIDVLLDVFATVRHYRPDLKLLRVGGPFTAAQRQRARDLGILDAIVVLPFVDRATLAAIYRRAAITLLPSEREGFGLPLVEALATGTPVVASDIPVLREVGGEAAEYRPVGDSHAWAKAVLALLVERHERPARFAERKARALARAACFSWSRYAASVVELYERIATTAGATEASMGRLRESGAGVGVSASDRAGGWGEAPRER